MLNNSRTRTSRFGKFSAYSFYNNNNKKREINLYCHSVYGILLQNPKQTEVFWLLVAPGGGWGCFPGGSEVKKKKNLPANAGDTGGTG